MSKTYVEKGVSPDIALPLLQDLIRFNTTNPPGNEAACIAYINQVLTEAGFDTTILAHDPARPNLVTRLAGEGKAPPLLLYGHVDVVPVTGQSWQHPPFDGVLADGCIWGRGALDMKGGVAMMLAALLRAKAEHLPLPGDVILAMVSDEEGGGEYGARYLVEHHAALFEGVRYALGECGGFTLHACGQRFYPIMVANKQYGVVQATIRGQSRHSSMPLHDGVMAQLGHLLLQLDHPLPVHITPLAQHMVETMASALPWSARVVLRLLLNPHLTDQVLRRLGSREAQFYDPLLRNIVNVRTINVNVSSEAVVDMFAYILPGYDATDLLAELRQVVGNEIELEILRYDPEPATPDMGLFATLATILREADPGGLPMPFLLPATSDGRFFSRLGIQTYGFLPMRLPEGIDLSLIHGTDERIPIEALTFGTNALYSALQRFGNAA